MKYSPSWRLPSLNSSVESIGTKCNPFPLPGGAALLCLVPIRNRQTLRIVFSGRRRSLELPFGSVPSKNGNSFLFISLCCADFLKATFFVRTAVLMGFSTATAKAIDSVIYGQKKKSIGNQKNVPEFRARSRIAGINFFLLAVFGLSHSTRCPT